MAFDFNTPFPETPSGWGTSFNRSLQHTDWVDGQDLVQAGDANGVPAFNSRFHQITADIDALAGNVALLMQYLLTTRHEVALRFEEIRAELNRPPEKTGKESKEGKETKEGKEHKEKETKETKDTKDTKETKEHKDHKDGKETKEKEREKGALGLAEKIREQLHEARVDLLPADTAAPDEKVGESMGRAFISPSERPAVGARIYGEA